MGKQGAHPAQLVNCRDTIGVRAIRRELEDVFAIRRQRGNRKALRVVCARVRKNDRQGARRQRPGTTTTCATAVLHPIRRKSLEYARQMFNRAIEIDPEYARAYAGVADCCSLLYTYFDAREFNLRQADIASSKALELEPELAEAHLARGIAASLSKRFAEAEKEFEQAMRLDPKLFEAPYFFGRTRTAQGRFEDAVKLFERASALRPEDFQATTFLAQSYQSMGMQAEAEGPRGNPLQLARSRPARGPARPRPRRNSAPAFPQLAKQTKRREYAERSRQSIRRSESPLTTLRATTRTSGKIDDRFVASRAGVAQRDSAAGMDRARLRPRSAARTAPRSRP